MEHLRAPEPKSEQLLISSVWQAQQSGQRVKKQQEKERYEDQSVIANENGIDFLKGKRREKH